MHIQLQPFGIWIGDCRDESKCFVFGVTAKGEVGDGLTSLCGGLFFAGLPACTLFSSLGAFGVFHVNPLVSQAYEYLGLLVYRVNAGCNRV